MPSLLRYVIRLAVLTAGAGLVTYGVITWHYEDYTTHGVWLYDNGWKPHAMHLLVIGTCMMPMAMWDIFVLEQRRAELRRGAAGEHD